MPDVLVPLPDVPAPFRVRRPTPADVNQVVALCLAHVRAVRDPQATVNHPSIENQLVGSASWTRTQVVVEDGDGNVVAWAWVYDRAAGRTNVDVIIQPGLPQADALAEDLIAYCKEAALAVARSRGLEGTTFDYVLYEHDARGRAWAENTGFVLARTWLEMERPVLRSETEQPEAKPQTRVRDLKRLTNGTPDANDLHAVHRVLEESFADHFNSYHESFVEFITRMREDPGHCWDTWKLADFERDGQWVPGAAVVASVTAPDHSGVQGLYIDYIGVHPDARGTGLGGLLLRTMIAEAAELGMNRVALEVDADSPTAADTIYANLGWETEYKVLSYHQDIGGESPSPKPLADGDSEA